MIETLEQAEARRVQECSLAGARAFQTSVRPIYANSAADPKPQHIGSCLLLDIDGRPVVSTAAHITDALSERMSLYVGGTKGTRPVPVLEVRIKATTAPSANRRLDHLDCAFWQPPDAAVADMGAVEFLNASRISHNRGVIENRIYTGMGYAVSKNKKGISQAARSISNRLSMYTGSVEKLPALATELGVSGDEHLFLRFGKYAFTADGRRVNAFCPIGLSGGALLDLGDFTSPAAYAADAAQSVKLAGMLIENKIKHGALVAVKIGPIVRGIERALARG
jgi:hypothetical protein